MHWYYVSVKEKNIIMSHIYKIFVLLISIIGIIFQINSSAFIDDNFVLLVVIYRLWNFVLH